jgi:hypothetical protein
MGFSYPETRMAEKAPEPLTAQDYRNLLEMIKSVAIPFDQVEIATLLKAKIVAQIQHLEKE